MQMTYWMYKLKFWIPGDGLLSAASLTRSSSVERVAWRVGDAHSLSCRQPIYLLSEHTVGAARAMGRQLWMVKASPSFHRTMN